MMTVRELDGLQILTVHSYRCTADRICGLHADGLTDGNADIHAIRCYGRPLLDSILISVSAHINI